MGWLFCSPSRKALIDRLLAPDMRSKHHVLIDHSVQGNNLWMLLQAKDDPEDRFIVLCMMSGSPGTVDHPDIRWGYKSMSESAGPCQVGCPQRLLDQSTCDAEWAVQWRQRCVEAREGDKRRREFIANLKPGDKFVVGGREITYAYPSPRNLSRYVLGYYEGTLYKWLKSRVTAPPEPEPEPKPEPAKPEPEQLALAIAA